MFTLNKEKNKGFTILQLTDVQIIDPNQRCYNERLSSDEVIKWQSKEESLYKMTREIVNKVNPDYIVLTGDNVYGEFDGDGSAFISFTEFMESFKIPWSFVNGNHDGEMDVEYNGIMYHCGKGMKWQGEYVMNNTKYCMYELGDEKMGYGNYVVNLKENNKTIYSFIFMDTHGARNIEVSGINKNQMEWYKNTILNIKKENGYTVDSLLFTHIPSYEYKLAIESNYGFEKGIITDDGSLNERGDFGKNLEKINYFRNDEFYQMIKELDSTKGFFAGHDHINNSSVYYDGIRFTYGTKIGIYDYYNQQGATVIKINDKGFNVSPIIIK